VAELEADDIRERVRQLPEASDEDRINITRALIGMRLHLENSGGKYTQASVRSYAEQVLRLFRRDMRSFAAMASTEYWQLIKSSASNKKHHSIQSAAITHFARFFEKRAAELGGEFKLDPKWGARLFNPGARTLPLVALRRPAPLESPAQLAGPAADTEMVEVSREVPIVDPISMARIQVPVRGKQCQHIQAFDRQPYVEFNQMMEKRRCRPSKLWNCPFCGNPAKAKDLTVVEAFLPVLAAAKCLPELTHVEALPDGTFVLPEGADEAARNLADAPSSQGGDSSSEDDPQAAQGFPRGAEHAVVPAAEGLTAVTTCPVTDSMTSEQARHCSDEQAAPVSGTTRAAGTQHLNLVLATACEGETGQGAADRLVHGATESPRQADAAPPATCPSQDGNGPAEETLGPESTPPQAAGPHAASAGAPAAAQQGSEGGSLKQQAATPPIPAGGLRRFFSVELPSPEGKQPLRGSRMGPSVGLSRPADGALAPSKGCTDSKVAAASPEPQASRADAAGDSFQSALDTLGSLAFRKPRIWSGPVPHPS